MFLARISALAAFLALTPAFADAPKPEPLPRPATTQPAADVAPPAFGARDPSCQEWSDGCQVCVRDAEGKPQCSTPGIACTPKATTCSLRKEAPARTEPAK